MNTVRGREYDREEEEGGMKWGETEKKRGETEKKKPKSLSQYYWDYSGIKI